MALSMPSIFLRTIGSIIRHSAHQSNHPNGIPIRSDCISILELTSTGLGIALECVAHIVLIVLIELVQCQNRKNHLSPFPVVPKSPDNRASDVAQDALLALFIFLASSRLMDFAHAHTSAIKHQETFWLP